VGAGVKPGMYREMAVMMYMFDFKGENE